MVSVAKGTSCGRGRRKGQATKIKCSDDGKQIACISPDKKRVVIYDVVEVAGGKRQLVQRYATPEFDPSIDHADVYFPNKNLEFRIRDKGAEDKARIETLAKTLLCLVVLDDGKLNLLEYKENANGGAFAILVSEPSFKIRKPRFTCALDTKLQRSDDGRASLGGVQNPVISNIGIIGDRMASLTLLMLIRIEEAKRRSADTSGGGSSTPSISV